jgi:hypothetical protein
MGNRSFAVVYVVRVRIERIDNHSPWFVAAVAFGWFEGWPLAAINRLVRSTRHITARSIATGPN